MAVQAGRLIDGVSRTPREQITIIIRDNKILDVKSGYQSPAGAEVIDLRSATVSPGLIDTHVHLLENLGAEPLALSLVKRSAYDQLVSGVANARKTLDAGFTSVRDLGGATQAIIALKRGISSGKVEGPRIWASGWLIGPTGGHNDPHNGFDSALDKPEWNDGVVDSPAEAVKIVRERHRAGTDLIKIAPSGGVGSDGDDPQAQLMTDEEISAVVQTAHALHMKVAAHAHGKLVITNAVKLGVDSIEHGSYGDAETDRLMKDNGVWLVPTLMAGEMATETVRKHPEVYSAAASKKALEVAPLLKQNLARAYKNGVKIAFGTDAGGAPHSANGREFQLLVERGMAPMDAIISATSGAAELIGATGQIGVVRAGAYADLIATAGDPLKDITELQRTIFVMKDGKVVKSPR